MASFPAKIGWKRPRKRENTNYHSVKKNTILALFQAKIGWNMP